MCVRECVRVCAFVRARVRVCMCVCVFGVCVFLECVCVYNEDSGGFVKMLGIYRVSAGRLNNNVNLLIL